MKDFKTYKFESINTIITRGNDMSYRSQTCTSLITIALAVGMGSNAAYAQNSNVLTDEVIVTATKKSNGENLQDTNLSVSAFGADQLEAFQVRDVSGLSFKTPNVSLDDIGTTKGTANFAVRGLGVNSSIPSIDPAVGVFVDGIYLGVNAGVIFDTFDLDSVEVLRGPQGVLFGKNVTGGAVLLNTGDPTDEFTFKAKVAAESGFRGTGENYYLQGVMSGPIIEDVLSVKLGVYHNNDKGWFENFYDGNGNPDGSLADSFPGGLTDDGENFGISDTTIIRTGVKWTPTDSFSLVAKYEMGDFSGQGPAAQSHVNGSGVNSFATNILMDPAHTFDRDSFDFAVNELGSNETEWNMASLRADLDVGFGNGTITNIAGWRELDSIGRSDIDATILTVFHANFGTNQSQFSNELRYNGRFLNDKLDFTAGLFYFDQTLEYTEQREVQGVLNFDGGGIQDHETIGAFASGEYQLSDRLSVNAGLRFTNEKKDADIAIISLANAPCIIVEGDPRSNDFCPLLQFPDIDTSNFSPKIGFGYEFSDNFRGYGHWSRAFRAGGFNLRNTALPAFQNDPIQSPGPFGDERVDSFEIGFKSEPVAGARVNAAAFFTDISDFQRELNIAGGSAVVQQIIGNSADAEIYGAEIDVLWPLSDNFVLNGSLGITEGSFTDVLINLTATTGAGLSEAPGEDDLALEIPRLIPFTANAGFTYFKDTGLGQATLNVNYAHRDRSFFTDNNLGFTNSQDRFDASLSLDLKESGVNVTIYGKNLTNEVLHGNDTQLSNGTFAPLSKGRVIGIEFGYEY